LFLSLKQVDFGESVIFHCKNILWEKFWKSSSCEYYQ